VALGLLSLAGLLALYTLLFPPRFVAPKVTAGGVSATVPIAGQPAKLVWESDNSCLFSTLLNGETVDGLNVDLGLARKMWEVPAPKAGDKLTVRLRGCTWVRTKDWTVEVAPAPPAPPATPVAPKLTDLAALALRTQNVQTSNAGTGGAVSQVSPEDQQVLLAGQTGELCIHWDVQESYDKDTYSLLLVTEPKVDAIARTGQIDQQTGEKCYPIAATFTDVITDVTQPKVYYMRIGAVEKESGNYAALSTDAKVVQLFKPVCRIRASESVWIREGPGQAFPERGIVSVDDDIFPLSSPLLLRDLGQPDMLWTPVTLANDPRPGWIAHAYLNCPVPIDVLPPSSQIPATPTPTPTASPTPTPLPTATPTPPPEPKFTVAPKIIKQGECAMLTWSIQNVEAVYLNGEGVSGESEREVCPSDNKAYIYTWVIINKDGSRMEKSVTLNVNKN
jgi:hypothetical protein